MKIADIKINPGRRKVDMAKAQELADSIAEIGLLNPICVAPDGTLVAGAHRIEACKILGWDEIPHQVIDLSGLGLELAEIDENLMRNELHFIERGDLLLRRKRIYEEIYPETKAGKHSNRGNRYSNGNLEKRQDSVLLKPSFTEDTADKLGVDKTTIEREIKIARTLPDEVKDYIIENEVGKTEALQISRQYAAATIGADEAGKEQATDDIIEQLQKKKAHVGHNSGENEWYTPKEYIEAARSFLGIIDLDPASCETANTVVQAQEYFTYQDSGLEKAWYGNVWLNPPYAQPEISQFMEKAVAEKDNYNNCLILVNNATETKWFQSVAKHSAGICFISSRVKFWHPERISAPLQGQVIIYIGQDYEGFKENFQHFGFVMRHGI